jgi:hypothetical protein
MYPSALANTCLSGAAKSLAFSSERFPRPLEAVLEK